MREGDAVMFGKLEPEGMLCNRKPIGFISVVRPELHFNKAKRVATTCDCGPDNAVC
ncbi:hypothetical protein Hanom_Chr01g00020631 [Helianthus anomalus]